MKKLVINLPHREDRKNKFLENGLTDVQFMEAVDGKKIEGVGEILSTIVKLRKARLDASCHITMHGKSALDKIHQL
jgi:hypothetical protein